MAIVKVQVPVFPPEAHALIYDKARKWTEHTDLDHETIKALGKDKKGYFEATLQVDAGIT